MWLVVKPTVGVPLFLSAVAIGSFCVHVAVLTNTNWVRQFLNGTTMSSRAEAPTNRVMPASVVFDQARPVGQTALSSH